MRISDWSSDVCSSDLLDKNTAADGQHGLFPQLEGSGLISRTGGIQEQPVNRAFPSNAVSKLGGFANVGPCRVMRLDEPLARLVRQLQARASQISDLAVGWQQRGQRSEEHTPALQSQMR